MQAMNYCQPTCQEVVPMVNHARRTCTQDNNKDDEHLGMAGRLFWDWALNKTLARAQTEGWTPRDCTAALMQSSLLSYTSAPGNMQLYGDRYSPTCPDDFVHNAPWNNWSPPSKSLKRFKEAQTNKTKELIDLRLRARLCASADAAGLRDSLIVFASVELNDQGKRCLRLRRGNNILATMTITSLRFEATSERMVKLAPRAHSKTASSLPTVFLSFENVARAVKLCDMLKGQ
jgi:hypothetical protein